MRVALTHAHCWPDVRRGGERYLHELAGALARAGHDVTIWSTSHSSPGEAVEDGVRVVRLPRPADGDARVERWFGARLLPHLLRERYDATHSLLPGDALACLVARRLGRVGRCVYTNLGIPDRDLWAARHDRRWHDLAVPRVDDYGCLSRAAAAAFESSFGRTPVLTPGGVDLAAFRPGAAKREHPTLLYSGTFEDPMKNVPLLLQALAVLAERRPDVRLLLSGPGDPEPLLRAAPPAARDRVEVLGLATPALAAEFGSAWATVLPSKWESFALVLVESLACGTPVVAARHGASPERVSPGTGLLCEPDDLDSLVDACDRVLDLAVEAGTAERCRAAVEAYGWDALVPHYEAVYRGERPAFAPLGPL